jgi:hypothetical protein
MSSRWISLPQIKIQTIEDNKFVYLMIIQADKLGGALP